MRPRTGMNVQQQFLHMSPSWETGMSPSWEAGLLWSASCA